MWFPVFCIWVFLSFIFAFDDDEDLMKRGKAISYPRFTQCGFLCNERPQCNFLLRNSKNPIFSSGSNFSSTSFPLRVKQVSASADGFRIIGIHDDQDSRCSWWSRWPWWPCSGWHNHGPTGPTDQQNLWGPGLWQSSLRLSSEGMRTNRICEDQDSWFRRLARLSSVGVRPSSKNWILTCTV